MDQDELQALRFSAVRSVALSEEHIQDQTVVGSKRFAPLLRYLYFESCIAVPIPVAGRDSKYGLFLFDPGPDQFTSTRFGLILSVARLLAAAVLEAEVKSLIQESQKSFLVGQLAASLLHEIRNKIDSIESPARNLELDCDELIQDSPSILLSNWPNQVRKRVERILNANAELRSLTHEYLGLMGKEKRTTVNVNDLILKTQRHLAAVARENGVEITTKLESRTLSTVAIPLQLEQVFLNVGLNAIQQMGAQPHRGGLLQITTQYDARDKLYPIKVKFADEGPGVHRKHWGWIFQMGTSTREGGTGLGLFASRGLLKSMGGDIALDKSFMFVSSTFLVKLAAVSDKEAGNE
jgi:signal transduction histidine kinase